MKGSIIGGILGLICIEVDQHYKETNFTTKATLIFTKKTQRTTEDTKLDVDGSLCPLWFFVFSL